MTIVEKLITSIAKTLDKNKVPYMIIGGQALLLYGLVRLTEDIDITLGVNIDSLPTLKNIVKKIGLIVPKNIDDDFVQKANVLIGLDNKTGIRVDFIFSFTPYEKQALKKAKAVKLNGYKVKFCSCEDLIIHKMFAGRSRDLEDVKSLVEKNLNKINLVYIKKWLRSFSIVSQENLIEKFERIMKESK